MVVAGGATRLMWLSQSTLVWRHLGQGGAEGVLDAASFKGALLLDPPQSWGRVREASRHEGGVRGEDGSASSQRYGVGPDPIGS